MNIVNGIGVEGEESDCTFSLWLNISIRVELNVRYGVKRMLSGDWNHKILLHSFALWHDVSHCRGP